MTIRQFKRAVLLISLILIIFSFQTALSCSGEKTKPSAHPFRGALRVHPENPRYFTDNNGKAIYLTGSHTWDNLQDNTAENPPFFDYEKYLDFIEDHNHNFIRLWVWEGIRESAYDNDNAVMQPMAYKRTGPGIAPDKKPLYDLTIFDQDYFDRLRQRVSAARNRGIYVGVMLFQGFSVAKKTERAKGNPWPGHPFYKDNNLNGIDGDPNGDGNGYETHTLAIKEITRLQEAYVQKVIETVGDFENIIYEIANEGHGGSTEWQYHIMDFIRQCESTRKLEHPVWISFQWDGNIGMGNNGSLFNSTAEVVSPSHQDNPEKNDYKNDPPVADGSKVIILDTDHLWGIGGDEIWVWKSFTRGHNPIFMDRYLENTPDGKQELNARWKGIRLAMGHTLNYADKMDLVKMIPTADSSKCSTRYCLVNPGKEYLVFQPDTSSFTLEIKPGKYIVEWFNPRDGKQIKIGEKRISNKLELFTAPFKGPSVLYLKR